MHGIPTWGYLYNSCIPALVDRHGQIKVPTRIVWGMDDPWQKSEDGQRLASEIPGAQFRALEGVSHWAPQDAPETFTQALREFFD